MNIFRMISEQFNTLDANYRRDSSLRFPFLATLDAAGVCVVVMTFTGFGMTSLIISSILTAIVLIISLVLYFRTDICFREKAAEITGWLFPLLYVIFIIVAVIRFG